MLGVITFGAIIFIGAIIWASSKLVSLINHSTPCTTLIQWNIPLGANCTGCAFLPQGRGKMVVFHFFAISQEYNYTLPAKNMEYFSLQPLQTHKLSKNRINRCFEKLIHGIQHFMRLESAILIIHDVYQGSCNPGENYIILIHANMLLKT